MPISFGGTGKVPVSRGTDLLVSPRGGAARLIDLRSAEKFRDGFIPGSYNVPDAGCWQAAKRSGLFKGRQIYVLTDSETQLALCEEFCDFGEGSELAGWFGADALDEWRRAINDMGRLETISPEALTVRLASWDAVVLDIAERGYSGTQPAGQPVTQPSHPVALKFYLDELPLSLDGLPAETSICVMARSTGMASFAASLMWNFGFHQICYVDSREL